ncbi:MAG: hypothetical protein Fur0012_06110 [Elusimicrobiota bacterium]
MKKLAFALLCLVSPLSAQQNQEEYKKLVEQLMKMKAEGASAEQASSSQFEAVIRKTAGTVSVKSSDDSEFKSVDDSGYYPLDPDDTVKTGTDGYAEIYFSDRGLIKLNRNSEIEIRSLEQEDSNIFLKAGSLVAKFEKNLKKKFSLSLHTPTAVCAVRGTEFGAEYSLFNKESTFGVYDEGEIAVSQLDKEGKSQEEIKVDKGSEITLSPDTKRQRVVKLSRLAKYRPMLLEIRKRHPLYKKRWRPMDRVRREKMRALLMKRKSRIEEEEQVKKPEPRKKAVKKKINRKPV